MTPCELWPHTNFSKSIKRNGIWTAQRANRYVWEQANGPIPAGWVVRSLCGNPRCVAVDHLELADKARSHNGDKTACDSGHDFTPENTWVSPDGRRRKCRACLREQMRRLRAARKQDCRDTP